MLLFASTFPDRGPWLYPTSGVLHVHFAMLAAAFVVSSVRRQTSQVFWARRCSFWLHCAQDIVHFGVCWDNILSFAFTGVLWCSLNSKALADIVNCFSFVNFLWGIGVTCLHGLFGDYGSVCFFHFFTGWLHSFTDFFDPLGLSIFSPFSSTCHPHQGLIVSPRHSLALCLVWNCHVQFFQRICCTIAWRSLPILWCHWWLQWTMRCIRGWDACGNYKKRTCMSLHN